ncbi:Transposon TX1 uncharacterized 149 kDa protein [Linum perenne]
MAPFNDFIFNNGLMDMGFKGQKFTWTNCKQKEENIMERLDRALCNVEWRRNYENAVLFHEPIIGLDHAPLRLEIKGDHYRKATPFRFDNRWLDYPTCAEIIGEEWSKQGNCHFKLNTLSRELKKWSKENVGNATYNIRQIQGEIDALLTEARTVEVVEREQVLLKRLKEEWQREEMFWGQRARKEWLGKGDRNTKFFHASTIQRMHRNKITQLKNGDGEWIEEESSVKQHINNFVQNLFTSPTEFGSVNLTNDLPQVITPEMNNELTKPPTAEEIKEAVFSLGPNKSPGPDGFSGNFYRKYWGIIGPQICQEVGCFFRDTRMPSGWNDTHLVIIPKVPHPEEITQFRPISCCNFNYKIISKILATRLKKWIPIIVSEMQAAFTSGRAIQDNIIIVHEVMHHFKNRSGKLAWDMMIKMDMKKAYDMVDWEGLDSILRAMGFSQTWCNWIQECIRTVKFSVMFNGGPSEPFTPTRGIRQGDPISPYLFIILTNSLSFLIEKGMNEGSLKGIKLKARCPTLTHVLFADDTIIFGEASVREATTIKATMEKYANLTGQVINNEKSSIMFSRHTPQTLKNIVERHLGFTSTLSFGKYLGVPTEWGRSKKEVFQYLLERMETLCQSWKSLTLSHGGKETMLKAVYQSILSYLMSCFLLPKDITKKMDSRLSAFFWGGVIDRRTIYWTKASILTKPKKEGGLGFRNFRMFNMALLAKQGWRLMTNPEQLWARLLKGLYYRDTDFLKAGKGKTGSWIWASLCDAREVLDKGVRKNIINGRSTRAFQDPWIPTIPTFMLRHNGQQNTPVEQWINEETREWRREEVERWCTPEEVNEILKIPIGPGVVEDEWIWHFDNKGKYTVRSGYHVIRTTSPNREVDALAHVDTIIWKWMWRIPTPPKFLFFVWRASRNALATKKNLWIRKCASTPYCPVCSEEEEDILHCLFKCPNAREVWRKTYPSSTLPREGTTMVEWLAAGSPDNPDLNTHKKIALMWNIWKARNEKVFRGKNPNVDTIIHLALKLSNEWISFNQDQSRLTTTSRHSTTSELNPPPDVTTQLKIFCDGSFDQNSPVAGYGVVCIDHHGQILDGKADRFLCSSALVAEAKALLEAIRMATNSRAHSMIHSDSQLLVKALQEPKEKWPWQCFAWISQMKEMLLAHDRISLAFIPRRMNIKADWVAKSVRSNILPYNWLENVP